MNKEKIVTSILALVCMVVAGRIFGAFHVPEMATWLTEFAGFGLSKDLSGMRYDEIMMYKLKASTVWKLIGFCLFLVIYYLFFVGIKNLIPVVRKVKLVRR